MKTNYVLIDYENVQPAAMDVLNEAYFKVIVFVGANQTKLTFEVASALQKMGERAEYVQISGNGSNALDFHIAFYIGQLATRESDAYFHIVSKDSGFDPLIQHLKARKILVCRSKDVTEIPIVKADQSKTPSERMEIVIADLQRRGASKPGTVTALNNTINSIFQKQLSDQELAELMTSLEKKGVIITAGTKLSYALPC